MNLYNHSTSDLIIEKFALFVGHYVVICGYDAEADEFEIRDPASSRYYLSFLCHCLAAPYCVCHLKKFICFVQGHIIILITVLR